MHLGSYTIDSHAFWWATTNINNRYSHNRAMYYHPFDRQYYFEDDVTNNGYYLLDILENWQSHPKLSDLIDEWDSKYDIT